MEFSERVWENIFQKLCYEEHEIDPLSVKFGGLINLLKFKDGVTPILDAFLKKGSFFNRERKKVYDEICAANIFERNGNIYNHTLEQKYLTSNNLIGLFSWIVDEIKKKFDHISELKCTYHLTPKDVKQVEQTVESPYWGSYCVEPVKIYLNTAYGYEKWLKRNALGAKKSEQMKKMIEVRTEKNDQLKKDRQCYVLDLLASAGLYMSEYMYNAQYYIDGDQTITEKQILEEAQNIFNKNREMEVRKGILKEALDRYGMKKQKNEGICRSFINYGSNTVDNIVNSLRERNYLEKNTNYNTIWRKRDPHLTFYSSDLQRSVSIREYTDFSGSNYTHDDYYKSYAIEDKLRKNGWDINSLGEVPPFILRRVEDVIERREANEILEVSVKSEIEAKQAEIAASKRRRR